MYYYTNKTYTFIHTHPVETTAMFDETLDNFQH